jgi:hypothetical protein
MMKKVLFAIGFGALLTACGSSGSDSGSGSTAAPSGMPARTAGTTTAAAAAATTAAPPATSAAPAALTPGGGGYAGAATEAGAKAVVAELQKAADPKAAMAKLKPGLAELKALFSDEATANAVAAQTEEMFSKGDKVEFPKGDAAVFCASSDDVKAWKPDVEKNFPGGYKRVGAKLNGGIPMCKFKIGGIAFDALVNIKGNWFLVAKPFRAIKE